MWLHLLKGRHAQDLANAQLQVFAGRQQAVAQYRQHLASATLQLQRCDTLEQLAAEFLTQGRFLLGAVQGVLYVADPESPDMFLLAGSSACAGPAPEVLDLGDGLLGQCALDKKMRVIATPPHGVWTLRSGLGDTAPVALMLGPVTIQDSVIGLVELAVLQMPDETATEKYVELLAALANSLEILRRNLLLKQMANLQADAAELNL
jgi:hypothetical protein